MQVNSAKFFNRCSIQESNQKTVKSQKKIVTEQQRLRSSSSKSQIRQKRVNVLNVESYQQQQQQSQQQKQSSNNEAEEKMFNFVDDDYLQQLIHVQSQDESFLTQNGQQEIEELESQLAALIQEQKPLESNGEPERSLPTQGEAVVKGGVGSAVQEREIDTGKQLDIDYLQELIAIQQNGPKNIGFFGSRNMGFLHQQLVEVLSYAIVLTGNHVFTSGATGTNAAVIRGALRAEKPELLTVVLPQSLKKQPQESQELLQQVERVIEMPQNDELSLIEASRICNKDIIGRVVQIICFAFHDSSLLLETCREAKQSKKMVTLFYLD